MILITNNKITSHHCPSHNILFSLSYKNKKIIKHSVLLLQTKNALVLSLSLQKFIQSGLLYTHVPISQPYFRLRGTCMYFYSTHTHTVKAMHVYIPIIISTAQFRGCYLERSPCWVERIFYHLCLVDCCKTAGKGIKEISSRSKFVKPLILIY